METIARSRGMVEDTSRQLTEFNAVRAEIQSHLESLRQSREEVLRSDRLLSDFRKASHDAELTAQQILQRLGRIDEVHDRVRALEDLSQQLEAKFESFAPRLEFVEGVESRLNLLNDLSRDIDHRAEQQLARRAELESMRVAQQGLAQQLSEVQRLVTSLQGSKVLTTMDGRLAGLEQRLEAFESRLPGFEAIERSITDSEKRALGLAEKVDQLGARVETQNERLGVLNQEVERVNDRRKDWLQEVSRVESRQKELHYHSETTELQLRKVSDLARHLDERRNELAVTERKLSQYDERVTAFETLLSDLNGKMDYLKSREDAVSQIQHQVDTLFETCERTRNHAMAVVGARQEIAEAREKLDKLAERSALLDGKLGQLEAGRAQLEESEFKINVLNNILSDIDVNLEHFKQQKANVDHLAEKLARLEFTIKQAEAMMKLLQDERELAGRIQHELQSVRGVRVRPGGSLTRPSPEGPDA
jgi:chromosome segregation ATPase